MADNSKVNEDMSIQENKNFGRFKIALADILTIDIIIRLATLFMFPSAKIDEIKHTSNHPGYLMISLMEERGQIKPSDISPLLVALDELKLYGILSAIKQIIPNAEGKKFLFVGFLKTMYTQLYNQIRPLPYIYDKVCCVNDVFVEGGIEIKDSNIGQCERSASGRGSNTVKLESHRDVFNDNVISSKRILLEGDPGYGKSTFTLQAAYDWCSGGDLSPLKTVEIFILLPLRFLRGISSICLAIKLLLMPGESQLTEGDIMNILLSCSSVVIILDGYDEYPDKDSKRKTDVIKLIAGKMFANFKVITCTRSAYLPKDLDVRTVKLCLTGFDKKARDGYIKTVVGNDRKTAIMISDLLSNPVLGDICQVPLFCVMFAHISSEEKNLTSFFSVTSFFKYMLICVYDHMWKKTKHTDLHEDTLTIPDHIKLNKVAFDGLTGKNHQLYWQKNDFMAKVGNECYNELITLGILIEEDIFDINGRQRVQIASLITKTTIVRFYHKLFAEWYAANYLSTCARSPFPFGLRYKLKQINPLDLQFVFRFSCGLNNRNASERIIKYLKGMKDGESFASLCFFEQVDKADDVADMVKDICSGGVTIKSTDSRLLQRSRIQILALAAQSEIHVDTFILDPLDTRFENDVMILGSGICLPAFSTIENILIKAEGREVTEEEVVAVLIYANQCQGLNTFRFEEHCMLPLSINTGLIPSHVKSWTMQVHWRLSDHAFLLNLQSGQWELDDIESVRQLGSCTISIKRSDDILKQRSTIQLLQMASHHNTSIPCLHLEESFSKVDAGCIILHSELILTSLLKVDKIFIIERGREMKEADVVELVMQMQRSHNLKEVRFVGCLLPQCINDESISSSLNKRNVSATAYESSVSWYTGVGEYDLNIQSGTWMSYNTGQEITDREYADVVKKFRNH